MKCLRVGMRLDSVLSDEDRIQKFKNRKKKIKALPRPNEGENATVMMSSICATAKKRLGKRMTDLAAVPKVAREVSGAGNIAKPDNNNNNNNKKTELLLQNYYGYNSTTHCSPNFGPLSQYYSRPHMPIPRPLKRRNNGFYYIGPVRRPPWREGESEDIIYPDINDNNRGMSSLSKNKNKGNNAKDTTQLGKKKRNVVKPVVDSGMSEIHGDHPCNLDNDIDNSAVPSNTQPKLNAHSILRPRAELPGFPGDILLRASNIPAVSRVPGHMPNSDRVGKQDEIFPEQCINEEENGIIETTFIIWLDEKKKKTDGGADAVATPNPVEKVEVDADPSTPRPRRTKFSTFSKFFPKQTQEYNSLQLCNLILVLVLRFCVQNKSNN